MVQWKGFGTPESHIGQEIVESHMEITLSIQSTMVVSFWQTNFACFSNQVEYQGFLQLGLCHNSEDSTSLHTFCYMLVSLSS